METATQILESNERGGNEVSATRRQFGGFAISALVQAGANAAALPMNRTLSDGGSLSAFPTDFTWGAATSSLQIEGALTADGRGESIWDRFARAPGKIHGGDKPDVAADSYHRTADDIAAMRYLGLRGYRFSISWPRIFPTGRGALNRAGIDHYRRFCDNLLEVGIEPFCTLYHWDLPQALEEQGGWLNRDTASRFADYAAAIVHEIPEVRRYFTMNETVSFTEGGYGSGVNAPGRALGARGTAQASHIAMLAHGLAIRAMRATARKTISIGSAEVGAVYIPLTDEPAQIEAARRATILGNAAYVSAVQTGAYPNAYLASLGTDAPEIRPDDMAIIGTATDMQGLNIYYGQTVRAEDNEDGFVVVPRPSSYPKMLLGWATIDPEALYWGPRLFAEAFGLKSIYITENGVACADPVDDKGKVYDTDRVMFLRSYLAQLQRATLEGVPVHGYFHWSLLDNFEWLEGYSKRFGLFRTNYDTLSRTPKLSADVYRSIIAANGVFPRR
jgi:beta-glucosidase